MKLFFSVGVILFMFSFLCGCSSLGLSSDYEKIADKITEKTAKKLKTQKNLCLVGTAWISSDSMRQYRPPSIKGKLGKVQANFERKIEGQTWNNWPSNGHLDILD